MCPVSCLLEQFGSIFGSKGLHFLYEFRLLLFVELRRRRRTCGDGYSNLQKKVLLPCRGTDAEQPGRIRRSVVELMGERVAA